jgi:ADP-L-glycero-D-manno-heptose 6-epimerase
MSRPLVLVTGGAGFIGSNIVARLTEDPGMEVVVCDRLGDVSEAKWRNIAKHPVADIIPPTRLFDWIEANAADLELVIHMGAVSSTLEPDVDLIVASNFALSRDLFRWCAAHRRRLIYASSAATYGDGGRGFEDRADLGFLCGLRPLNAYGWSKALFDIFCVRETAKGAAPPHWTGLKFFNVYGPNEGHKGQMSSIIAQMWPRIAAGETVRLFRSDRADYADGGQLRDFVYVRDAVDAVAWLARSEGPGGLFNLGSGKARSFADLARAVFAAIGQEPRIEYVDMPLAMRGRYQYFTEAPMDRLRAAGWPTPATELEQGVSDYVTKFLATDDPYV